MNTNFDSMIARYQTNNAKSRMMPNAGPAGPNKMYRSSTNAAGHYKQAQQFK